MSVRYEGEPSEPEVGSGGLCISDQLTPTMTPPEVEWRSLSSSPLISVMTQPPSMFPNRESTSAPLSDVRLFFVYLGLVFGEGLLHCDPKIVTGRRFPSE